MKTSCLRDLNQNGCCIQHFSHLKQGFLGRLELPRCFLPMHSFLHLLQRFWRPPKVALTRLFSNLCHQAALVKKAPSLVQIHLIYTLRKGHFESLSAKTVILSFLENKRLLHENSLYQINRVIYLKATYRTKKKETKSFFQLLPLNTQTFLTVALKLFGTIIQI